MKSLFATIFIIAFAISVKAQIYQSDTLTTIAYWSQGETYKYQLDKYRYRLKGEEITETNSTSMISLHIMEETDSNYLLKYSIDSLFYDGQMEDNPILNAIASEMTEDLVYIIETDQNGSFIEIRNWEELRDLIKELFYKLPIFNNLSKAEKLRAEQGIITMTDSKEKVQSILLKQFSVLFENYGYLFDTRDTIAYDQVLPNPYGGAPFPQYGKIFFDKSLIDSTNTITIYDQSSIDEEEGKKAIVQVLKQISPDLEDIESEIEKIEFKVEDSKVQSFHLDYGIILYAIMERTVISNDTNEKNTRIDRQTWNLLSIE